MRAFYRTLAIIALLGAMAPMLSACGKKSSPSQPGPANRIIYPGTYPPAD